MTEITPQNKPLIEVQVHNGVPATTSRNIAAVFEKRHDVVIRDIRNIFANNTDTEFNLHNFVGVEYTDAKGQKRPEYILTRDGAMMLIMSYTGPKAMALKTAYIKRFNEMEQALNARDILQPQQAPRAETAAPAAPAVPFNSDTIAALSCFYTEAGLEGNQKTLATDRALKQLFDISPLAIGGVQLKAPTNYQLLTPTEIGKQLGIGAREVNGYLAAMGYQARTAKGWELTDKGRAIGGVYLDVNKRNFNGAPIRQLKWPALVVGRVHIFRDKQNGINTLTLLSD